MKKFFVIGNPISHSLSPELHNFWIKKNNINAVYEKKKLEEKELKNFIDNLRKDKIHGINVTVPFKNKVIKTICLVIVGPGYRVWELSSRLWR